MSCDLMIRFKLRDVTAHSPPTSDPTCLHGASPPSREIIAKGAPTQAGASVSFAKQARQLGDVARYAPRFIERQHLSHKGVIGILA